MDVVSYRAARRGDVRHIRLSCWVWRQGSKERFRQSCEAVDLVIRSVHYLRRPVQAKSVYDPDYWEAYKEEVLLFSAVEAMFSAIWKDTFLPWVILSPLSTNAGPWSGEIAARFFTTDWQEEAARLACKNGVAVELHCATRTPRLDSSGSARMPAASFGGIRRPHPRQRRPC